MSIAGVRYHCRPESSHLGDHQIVKEEPATQAGASLGANSHPIEVRGTPTLRCSASPRPHGGHHGEALAAGTLHLHSDFLKANRRDLVSEVCHLCSS
jgi:hypothetical protein